MGCDIHPHVERRVNGHWERIPDAPTSISNRNYDVFAILANVRNGYGFAGHPTGGGLPVIAEPRGLPADIAQPLVAGLPYQGHWAAKYPEGDSMERAREDYGDHSQSWLTLAELLAFDWSQDARKYGVVTKAQYEDWDHVTRPESYCGWISGRDIAVGYYDQPDTLRDATHVCIEWTEKCADLAHAFFDEVIPWLIEQGEPDDVRLVFGFDS
jgi:hypothetical protein